MKKEETYFNDKTTRVPMIFVSNFSIIINSYHGRTSTHKTDTNKKKISQNKMKKSYVCTIFHFLSV